MKSQTRSDLASGAGNGRLESPWFQFWFRPADPTTLGLIRIVAGVLVLYVHLAYCFDLRAFFGPNSWFDLRSAELVRSQQAFYAPPLNQWEEEVVFNIRLPMAEDRREAVVAFLRRLPDDPKERDRWLRYLYQLPKDPVQFRQGLSFIGLMPEEESEWAARVDKILKASPDLTEFDPEIPPFIRSQPPEARELFQGEVIRFLRVLPRDREQRGYVLEFFQDNLAASEQLREFINGLPVDAAERMAVLDYVALWNFDPAQAWAHGQPIFSIWYHVTSPAGMWATHAAILVIMALFTLGFCTRITSVLTWLAAVSYIHRSNQVLFGMDTMMNILLFYLMIAPSGAALSIDRLIERYRILRASYRRSGRVDELARAALAGPRPSVTANLVTRMMQIHFCIIYIAAGLSKLKGETWWAHYAPWLTMVNPEFSPVTLPVYLDLMEWLGGQRLLHALVMFFGVGFTLTLEIGFPFLVWTRLRPYMVMGSVLLHFMIVVFMGLSVFSLFMMALVLCFISPQAVRERLTAGAGLPRLRLRFHSAQPRQLRRASLVGAADVADQVELIDEAPKGEKAPREAAPISVSAQGGGDARSGFGAFALLLRSLRLLRPFAWLLWVPGFAALGRALYPSRPAKPPSGDAGAAAPGDKAKTVA